MPCSYGVYCYVLNFNSSFISDIKSILEGTPMQCELTVNQIAFIQKKKMCVSLRNQTQGERGKLRKKYTELSQMHKECTGEIVVASTVQFRFPQVCCVASSRAFDRIVIKKRKQKNARVFLSFPYWKKNRLRPFFARARFCQKHRIAEIFLDIIRIKSGGQRNPFS